MAGNWVLVELAGSTLWPDCILGILSFVFSLSSFVTFCYIVFMVYYCSSHNTSFSRSKIQQMLFRSTGREV